MVVIDKSIQHFYQLQSILQHQELYSHVVNCHLKLKAPFCFIAYLNNNSCWFESKYSCLLKAEKQIHFSNFFNQQLNKQGRWFSLAASAYKISHVWYCNHFKFRNNGKAVCTTIILIIITVYILSTNRSNLFQTNSYCYINMKQGRRVFSASDGSLLHGNTISVAESLYTMQLMHMLCQ